MSGKKQVVYWDTCAFLTLLKEERAHGPGVYEALCSQAGAFDRGEIILATSMIGIAEVLAFPLPDDERQNFESMIRRSNFQSFAVTENVARKAAEIRSHCYRSAKANGAGTEPFVLAMPDAIHVATAVILEADVLVTLDTKNKTVDIKRREMGMTTVASYFPVPGMKSIAISVPGLGLPGTSLLA